MDVESSVGGVARRGKLKGIVIIFNFKDSNLSRILSVITLIPQLWLRVEILSFERCCKVKDLSFVIRWLREMLQLLFL